jgi:multidrug efflux pump subunit AcrA (membrane-fusion protein)
VRPVRVRTGLTDGQETEIVAADLQEGMQVVAGIVQSDEKAATSPFQSTQSSGGPRGPRLPGM